MALPQIKKWRRCFESPYRLFLKVDVQSFRPTTCILFRINCKFLAIYDSTGYIYKVGSTKDMTYFACGTSIDWSYGVAKIPYSYMVELRSRKYKFKLPRDQIMETCTEIWSAVKSLMDYVDQHPDDKNKPQFTNLTDPKQCSFPFAGGEKKL